MPLVVFNKHIVLIINRQSAPNLQVLVGTNDLAKGGRYYKVANFTTHEHYDDPRFAYDIAVIKLQEKIEFNEKVQPIELQREEVPDGVEVQLTGWGRLRVSKLFYHSSQLIFHFNLLL